MTMTDVRVPKIAVSPAVAAGNQKPSPKLLEACELSLFYGGTQALKTISLEIGEKVVTAFIGPSGCGKSSLLRCFNRMNDLIDNVRIQGTVKIADQDINSHEI